MKYFLYLRQSEILRIGELLKIVDLPEILEHLADHLLLGTDQESHHVVPIPEDMYKTA